MTVRKHEQSRALDNLRLGALGVIFALSACATPDIQRGPEQIFSTPEQAIDAFVAANRANNKTELLRILGPNAADLVSSGDPIADEAGRHRFLMAYDAAHDLQSEGDDKKVLKVGPEEWPMPIPLVRFDDGWQWSTDVGREEIINRRIGRNELNTIEVCREYVAAQREYAALHRHRKGKPEYAQHFISKNGKQDGLYWHAVSGKAQSPLGPLVAEARTEGYEKRGKVHFRSAPFHGYYLNILKEQGPNAPGGTKSYVKHGRMTGGFALIAFPAKYGDSGIMTFMVDETGIVYEKNLGPNTAKIALRTTKFDPDTTWKPLSAGSDVE